MKKKLSFLRSMKFGMILLVVILVLCFAGSMIVQGRTGEEYISRYGESSAKLIQWLGLDHVFSTPYFVLVGIALCLNLIDCSAARLKATLGLSRSFLQRCKNAPVSYAVEENKIGELKEFLKKKHFRPAEKGGSNLFLRDVFGFWGSFITHLSLLLILLVGTVVLYGADVKDISVFPGESAVLEDGTEIAVESFRTTDEAGGLDYASVISVTLPDGSSSGMHEIKVNTPLRMGKYKVYQQSYATAGSVELTNEASGESDFTYLDSACFLTLDGKTGLYYEGIYPGYKRDENGEMLIAEPSSSSDYSDPVYLFYSVTESGMEPQMLFPGDEISAGGIRFTIGDAAAYPGLRVKALSGAVLVALYLVFAMIIIGLYILFFRVPVGITVAEKGFSLVSSKAQTGLLLELEAAGFVHNVSL